jgi:phage-related tail fiber protein
LLLSITPKATNFCDRSFKILLIILPAHKFQSIKQAPTTQTVIMSSSSISNLWLYICQQATNSTRKLFDAIDLIVPRLEAAEGRVNKPGTIILFASDVAPEGYLACDGQLVSRASYAALFSEIGTKFGEGDGTTTFAVPDCRGQFVRGLDAGRGLDTTARTRIAGASSDLGSVQQDTVKQHAHNMWGVVSRNGPNGDPTSTFDSDVQGGPSSLYRHDETGPFGDGETVPKNIALLYAIKY